MNPDAYYVNHQNEETTNLDYAFLDESEFVPMDSAPDSPIQNLLNGDTDQTETSFNFANISSTHFTPSPRTPSEREKNLDSEIALYINSLPDAFKQCKYFFIYICHFKLSFDRSFHLMTDHHG